jgi:uncharacterized protein YqhQ
MVRLHREGVNWMEQDFDLMALYASIGGKSHGRCVDGFILIICLCNVVIYSYVIHVTGIPY